MVSPDTWLRPHQHPDLSQYEHVEETENLSSHENPDKSELLTCERWVFQQHIIVYVIRCWIEMILKSVANTLPDEMMI